MQMKTFFQPRSVAVVGASKQPGKVGYELVRNLTDAGFDGPIYPVNPTADAVCGLTAYPDLEKIDPAPDLVLVAVPARFVPDVVEQCADLKVSAVVIVSAGFKEIGPEGAKLEQRIIKAAQHRNLRIIGPNCLGLIVPGSRLNASFGATLPPAGDIAYISQSGALLTAILDIGAANSVGFSHLISIGNKADVDELDLIRALGDDDNVNVIAGYLESINDGNAFIREADRISRIKPICLIKSGATDAGAAAASSHTGSMVGSEQVYESAFDRAGVIRCASVKQQFDLAQAFARQPLPPGPRVAVVTNAGGAGIMAADEIERAELVFAKPDPATEQKLAAALPPAANVHNPIDVLGDALADRYAAATEIALADPNIDAVLVLLTPQAMTQPIETAQALVEINQRTPDKPILTAFMGAASVAEANAVLHAGGLPVYDGPHAAIRTLRTMVDRQRWLNRPKRVVKLYPVNRHRTERIIDRALRRGELEVGEMESKEILSAYGFVTPEGGMATTADQAVAIADQIGYPVVMKVWSPDISHKSDVGGVRIGLNNAGEVRDAYDLMMFRIPQKQPDAKILGTVVQQMCSTGMEVILGMKRDPRFGPLMMFGMGGIFVEVLKDVSFYLAPLTGDEARQMLESTRTYHMLTGARGREGVDLDALAEALQRLSQLVTEFPQIQEMDINPFMIGPPGTTPVAVDARIRVEHESH